mgnify:CR=1 FL=1
MPVEQEAAELARYIQKKSGAPMSACMRWADGLLTSLSKPPERLEMARIMGLRLLGESLGVLSKERPTEEDEPVEMENLSALEREQLKTLLAKAFKRESA